ncbi:MAG: hypothetical protein QNL33_18960 [Akkermansiaceae bacterium]
MNKFFVVIFSFLVGVGNVRGEKISFKLFDDWGNEMHADEENVVRVFDEKPTIYLLISNQTKKTRRVWRPRSAFWNSVFWLEFRDGGGKITKLQKSSLVSVRREAVEIGVGKSLIVPIFVTDFEISNELRGRLENGVELRVSIHSVATEDQAGVTVEGVSVNSQWFRVKGKF